MAPAGPTQAPSARRGGGARLTPHASRLSLLIALAISGGVHAQQYRSEVRELPGAPPPAEQKSADELLKQTTDPYARALLLRDLAGAAAQSKDFARAARLLEQALATQALSGPAAEAMRRDLSQLLLASGNYKQLMPQLEAQVRQGNASPETLVALGAAYVEAKRWSEAIPLLQRALAATKTPDPSWKRALLAAYLGAGREREALPLLQESLREDPSQREDWARLVALALKAGDRERAQAALEISSRLGFLTEPEDRLRLVTLTAQIGAPFEAGSLLQGWLSSGALPPSAANSQLLATLWINAREPQLALAALEDVIARAPSAEAFRQKAQLHMDREEYPQAAQSLAQAVALGKGSGPEFLTLGMALYQQADIDAALNAFRRAGEFPAQAKLASEWVKYLESGKAREQALLAAARIRDRSEEVTLSGRLLGEAVTLAAPDPGGQTLASRAAASADGGDPLTPVGAERAGNADGSIPAWTGGLAPSQWPARYREGGALSDPYPSDRPLYTITAANLAQYRGLLSQGHQQLLQRHPSYALPVYETRRSVSYPQPIYDATQANQGRAKLLGSDALSGARLGFPFPKPQNGVEILWNHRVRYRGDSALLQTSQAVVQPSGSAQYLRQTERVLFRYGSIRDPLDLAQRNVLLYYLTWFGKGRNEVDFLALVHETANSEQDGRGVWVMPPKIPRMFRIPPVGYDQPFPGSDAMYFIDMVDMYNGAFDRYVWRLVGKRELIVPYNAYRLSDSARRYSELLRPGHLDPTHARYERHRVWVVEATERGGKRHAFGKRVFYVDEDSWNVLLVENYDRDDKTLWRFQEGHLVAQLPQSANAMPVVTYDLKDGRYFATRLLAEEVPPRFNLSDMRESEFLPAAVKNRYGR
ncbi:MAG TPA: DUF1329 domain-containing protein [Nevskiaceae bacterium]|nr:DUF1329 domain-containing protein [Nevskiaceae bacterium]